jgi:hypothetical protein
MQRNTGALAYARVCAMAAPMLCAPPAARPWGPPNFFRSFVFLPLRSLCRPAIIKPCFGGAGYDT